MITRTNIQSNEPSMRMRGKSFGEKGPLEIAQRIPGGKAVSVMDQHDKGGRLVGRVEKIGTHAATNGIFELGRYVFSQ